MSKNRRLKILIITDFLPYPLSSGGKICLFNFIDYLRKYHDFTLFIPSYSPEIEAEKAELNKLWGDVKLINVDMRVERNASVSTNFKFRVLKFLKRKIEGVINKISPEEKNDYKFDFTVPFKPKSKSYIKTLKEICDANDFDIIQVQFSGNLNLIEILPEKPVKIFEQIESQFDVLKDYAESIKVKQYYKNYLSNNSEAIENFYVNKYDAVFTLNANDTNYFKSKLGHAEIFTSPFGVLNKDVPQDVKESFIPKKIVFSGNESHHPNYDALMWYLSDIHIPISRRHSIKLYVTGMWSEGAQNRFKKITSNVVFEGFVEDYSKFLKDSIVIAPIRLGGGGLRTKILYAMANGAPVVTTSVGAFGIEGKHNEHFCVADSKTDFIAAIDDFIMSPEKKKKIISNAHSLIMNKYNQTHTSEIRQRQYLELTSNE